jgi:hypothetical protein
MELFQKNVMYGTLRLMFDTFTTEMRDKRCNLLLIVLKMVIGYDTLTN